MSLEPGPFVREVNGRGFSGYVPEGNPTKVLACLHGRGGNGPSFARSAGLQEFADSHGYVLVLPSAVNGEWDARTPSKSDDYDYIHAAVQEIANEVGTDHAYVCGHSMGSGMALRLAYWRAPFYAGVYAVHSGVPDNLVEHFEGMPHKIPVLKVNSYFDPVVSKSYTWEDIHHFNRLMAVVNGHGLRPSGVHKYPDNPADGPRVKFETWASADNVVSAHYLYWTRQDAHKGEVHVWPIKKRGANYEANEQMRDFFLTCEALR